DDVFKVINAGGATRRRWFAAHPNATHGTHADAAPDDPPRRPAAQKHVRVTIALCSSSQVRGDIGWA
ncbi:hypothetical protein, partial [Streptantibioticus silvisoli]